MSDKEPPKHGGVSGIGGGQAEKINKNDGKCESCGRKGKGIIFRFGKGNKQLRQRRKNGGNSVNSGCLPKRGRIGGGCLLCLKQPRAMDSSGESPASDFSNAECDCDVLKALIEKNDFYSKECNPHLDRF